MKGDAVKMALGVPVEPPVMSVWSNCGPVWTPLGDPKCTERIFPGAAEALLISIWGAAETFLGSTWFQLKWVHLEPKRASFLFFNLSSTNFGSK